MRTKPIAEDALRRWGSHNFEAIPPGHPDAEHDNCAISMAARLLEVEPLLARYEAALKEIRDDTGTGHGIKAASIASKALTPSKAEADRG